MDNREIIINTLNAFFQPSEENALIDEEDIDILSDALIQALEKGKK